MIFVVCFYHDLPCVIRFLCTCEAHYLLTTREMSLVDDRRRVIYCIDAIRMNNCLILKSISPLLNIRISIIDRLWWMNGGIAHSLEWRYTNCNQKWDSYSWEQHLHSSTTNLPFSPTKTEPILKTITLRRSSLILWRYGSKRPSIVLADPKNIVLYR